MKLTKRPIVVALVLAFALGLSACTTPQKETTEGEEKAPPSLAQTKSEKTSLPERENSANLSQNAPQPQDSAAQKALATQDAVNVTASASTGQAGVERLTAVASIAPSAPAPLRWNTESYTGLKENTFINAINEPLSTFAIDVDTASYANIRRFITQNTLPPVDAIRLEEMVNYFTYNYPQPSADAPLAIYTEAGPSPFHNNYSLVKIGIRAKGLAAEKLPPSNLVFLVDVSGSMQSPDKLPLLQKAMKMLTEQLGTKDRIAIVTYAGSSGILLEPTRADQKEKILNAIESMRAGGSTNGAGGIVSAYELAEKVYIPEGNNRVILASDGDFNVGTTSKGELEKLIAGKRDSGIYLTVLGFGTGNYHDDTMEVLADKGNGNYAYIDSLLEAKKVLVKEMGATLFTVASDVKIQVEFNPTQVGAYRLIGYENRALADEDFHNDKKDAGEIGAGHTVTALYEIIPAGHKDVPKVSTLKYQKTAASSKAENAELLTVKLRYKNSGETHGQEISQTVREAGKSLQAMSDDFRFAAAVAGYGMLLQHSEYLSEFTWNECIHMIQNAKGADVNGYRAELLRLVELSNLLAHGK